MQNEPKVGEAHWAGDASPSIASFTEDVSDDVAVPFRSMSKFSRLLDLQIFTITNKKGESNAHHGWYRSIRVEFKDVLRPKWEFKD